MYSGCLECVAGCVLAVSCYILNRIYAHFTEGVSVVYFNFPSIHILCTGGD